MLSRIQASPGVSRAELARAFGFSEMAATRIARDLLSAGIVEEIDLPAEETSRRRIGRPRIGLRIRPESMYAAGITVSAYFSEVSITDADGGMISSRTVDDVPFDDIGATAARYADVLQSLIGETGLSPERMVGVGIALSARTSAAGDRIVGSEYFGWGDDGGRFRDEVRARTGLPVEVENIANALALSEMRFGAARDVQDFALVHVATFAGVGLVSDGRLVRGAASAAGRIGHVRSIRRPLTCPCGRSDCLNLSATGFGLLSTLGVIDHAAFERARLADYARLLLAALEDPARTDAIGEAGARLAPALDLLSKLFGPERIILSGALGRDPTYFEGARNALAAEQDEANTTLAPLVMGQLAPSEAAALLALHTFGYSDRLDFERLSETADLVAGASVA